jgi:uncharacterized protein
MYSEHNIVSQIRDSKNYFIVNLLSRNADILEPELGRRYLSGSLFPEEASAFEEKGYITGEKAEAALYRRRYLDFIEARDNGEVQLFFVPTYACNFACAYCYQNAYNPEQQPWNREVTDAFFAYIDGELSGRRKYVTIFGGEPLLPSPKVREGLEYFIRRAGERSLGLAVVTNGYHLREYLDLLGTGDIREIQVTLDGPRDVHNRRRPLQNGQGSFDAVVEGVDEALSRGLPVNLRVVLDRENTDALPELARFARRRGWTERDNFTTQFGRNYELHVCQKEREKIFSRIGLYEKIYALLRNYPEVGEFHRPAYSISRFLFDNGELPEPLFDSCPGCTTEWAFDYTGKIYSCTATVGKEGEELGTFYPEMVRAADRIEEWEDRDVLSIPECGSCSVRLACGGGCASAAKNSTGKLHAPDCRPVRELLELGMALYFEKESIPAL